jgi:hypothetical protein
MSRGQSNESLRPLIGEEKADFKISQRLGTNKPSPATCLSVGNSRHVATDHQKASLLRTNWERTLVQISDSPNYRSATVNMLMEVIKRTSRVF